ncbi:radical SAM protein [Lysobacter sp. 2RAF19]
MAFTISPASLTILCTYRCTAACEQCCFESSPHLRGQLDGDIIRKRISEAAEAFPRLRIVVFSGGEPLLLKEALIESVSHCTSLGLQTRIVSNGSWAKRLARARDTCRRLAEAGLTELNLSTGRDHQQWVGHEAVVNAAEAAVDAGVRVLVTVETDTDDSQCVSALRSDPRIVKLASGSDFGIQANFWMPFHAGAPSRHQAPDFAALRKGCSQVFNNIVITPADEVSACCGLTFEHIPEMKLGRCSEGGLAARYRMQEEDFLKYWLKVDGPYSIIERLLPDLAPQLLEGVVHQCQACVILHQRDDLRALLTQRYPEFVPEVMTRHAMAAALDTYGSATKESR